MKINIQYIVQYSASALWLYMFNNLNVSLQHLDGGGMGGAPEVVAVRRMV